MWALLMGSPPEDQFRLVLAPARRLDTAHRQLQRVREGLAAEHLGVGSPLGRRQILEVVGDAETAMVALNKALRIALTIPGSFRVNVGVPREISERAGFVERMRDHYEHIEARAVGKIKDRKDPAEAIKAFDYGSLIERRKFSDGTESLGIDGEATELVVAVRDYLVAAWMELVERATSARAAQRPAPNPPV